LDEVTNDITGATPACFEPVLDYVVVKIPRFAFEKFPGADPVLTTHMKSVGEAMSIGRNFAEALGKAMRSMETKAAGFWTADLADGDLPSTEELLGIASVATDGRLYAIERAMRAGASIEQVAEATGIDPWFVDQFAQILEIGQAVAEADALTPDLLRMAKRHGLSDRQLAALRPELAGEDGVRRLRHRAGIHPVFKTVDTCAAEFAASTPYHYSCYDSETEVSPQPDRPKVLILGSGPNRIGQGIEFDYSCVHAVMALRAAGYETVMINCNPETVSTDYDTADRLYFEPLTFEDVLEVVHAEQESGTVAGVICTLGGQTPLGLAQRLKQAGVPVLGTQPEAIDLAEDRGEFGRVLAEAGLPAPKHGLAVSFEQARAVADEIGYPVLVRPSYVLGGRGMEIVYDELGLSTYIAKATDIATDRPVLVDRFLDDSVEIDVDALYDGTDLYLGGVMEHIEEAGIHSGDSACALPPITLGSATVDQVRAATKLIAQGVGVRGLLNVQYALSGDILYVLEANPRASRTVPFVSKATAVPLAKAAARIALGTSIAELRAEGMLPRSGDGGDLPTDAPIAVKEAVLPFHRFRTPAGDSIDSILGPEMKSTGEVMGFDRVFGTAFAKSQAAAYGSLPVSGTVFVSVANRDKRAALFPVKRLADLGFRVLATEGTAQVLRRNGVAAQVVGKFSAGTGNVVEKILAGEVDLVLNTPFGSPGNSGPRVDGYEIRTAAVQAGIPCLTTVQAIAAAVQGIEELIRDEVGVASLQSHHRALANWREGNR
ncbi:MAG: carbamoyl-phosphate synthase large subunit, partial [Jatrophihabitantaceae bacterium]